MSEADIQRKYAGYVDFDHSMAMQAVALVGGVLSAHRSKFEALLAAEQQMHVVGGLIDPTLYKDMLASNGLKQQVRLFKAALAFIDEFDAVKAEIEAGK